MCFKLPVLQSACQAQAEIKTSVARQQRGGPPQWHNRILSSAPHVAHFTVCVCVGICISDVSPTPWAFSFFSMYLFLSLFLSTRVTVFYLLSAARGAQS